MRYSEYMASVRSLEVRVYEIRSHLAEALGVEPDSLPLSIPQVSPGGLCPSRLSLENTSVFLEPIDYGRWRLSSCGTEVVVRPEEVGSAILELLKLWDQTAVGKAMSRYRTWGLAYEV